MAEYLILYGTRQRGGDSMGGRYYMLTISDGHNEVVERVFIEFARAARYEDSIIEATRLGLDMAHEMKGLLVRVEFSHIGMSKNN